MTDSVQYQISKADLYDWLNNFSHNILTLHSDQVIITENLEDCGIPVKHEMIRDWIIEWCDTMTSQTAWIYEYNEDTYELTAEYDIPFPDGINPDCGSVAILSLPANQWIPPSVRNLVKRREA